jgi:predicted anti-sigma-YlaC factor YlaD
MKNECNVAKDLMPLVIDGVASEESKQYVNEHVAECTECAIAYGEMRVELPRISAEKERTARTEDLKREINSTASNSAEQRAR